MKFNIFKRAFSLTELLIVLVVVAVLFAAMVPFATKRNRGQTEGIEPIWMYVKDDPQKSAFFDPGSSAITSTAYIGFMPSSSNATSLKPFSKVVVRAKELQNHIQFRSGNDGSGSLAGIFLATPQNMILGSRLRGDTSNNYNEMIKKGGQFNTILGSNAASNIYNTSKGVAVGASASMGKSSGTASQMNSTVAVGNKANLYAIAQNSTLIGANVGKSEYTANPIIDTVAIGASNLGLPTSSGSRNVLLGYGVGAVGFDSTSAADNVILNSPYYGTFPKGNTIIGYKTYQQGHSESENVTAIGYNACASFNASIDPSGIKGSTTCIGYNSANSTGIDGETKYLGWGADSFEHLFIGGKPNGGFPGRSILEVHNIPYHNSGSGQVSAHPYSIGPTVVLNSHLVVRGNLYIPDSNDGEVSAFGGHVFFWDKAYDTVRGRDRCGRKCFFGGRGWRDAPKCKWLKIIAGALLMAGIAVGLILSGAAVILAPEIIASVVIGGTWGVTGGLAADALFNGEEFDRPIDVATFSGLNYAYKAGKNLYNCSTNNEPYFHTSYCPNVLRSSDIRLKDNVVENSDSIEKLLLLSPYNYTYKSDKSLTPQVGVMAQDLEKVFSTAVFEDKNGYKNIRWDEIFFTVINSVKSLDESVSAIDKDVKALESNLESLGDEQKSIKTRIKDINDRITKLENE